jgi:esterase/lipase
MSKLTFTSDGYKLAGNLFMAERPKDLAFLFIQGWTGRQALDAAQALVDLGYSCMTYDMRGNRDSQGELADFSRADFIKDACVAYDYFREQLAADVKIGVIGSSFGSYTGVLLSAQRDVHCLSLRVPANYPDEGFDEPQLASKINSDDFRQWREEPQDYRQNSALKALHDFTGNIQTIEAGADELVPHQTVKNYVDAVVAKGRLQYEIVPNAPHSIVNDELRADYVERLVAWVKTS